MIIEERHRIILEELNKNGIVTLADLTVLLDSSESTIRRDLNSLHNDGKLKKVHGGAVSIGDNYSKSDYKVTIRKEINHDEKDKIAKVAAELIEEGDVIYIDAGTTTELLIHYLTDKNITVVTNGISHAKKLLDKNIKTFILGGEIKNLTEAIVGVKAVKDIQSYNFSKGFFGANGVSEKEGCTTPDISEAMIKSEAIKHCKEPYVLVDESKINEASFVTFCKVEDVTIITNNLGEYKFNSKVIEAI